MLRRLLSYLVLCAVAAGFVPAGWMPAQGHDGKVLLVICTGTGPVEAWVDLDGGDGHAPAEQMEDRSCPFAALAAVATLPGSLAGLNLNAPLADRWSREAFTHASAGLHWRYDARGPPALS